MDTLTTWPPPDDFATQLPIELGSPILERLAVYLHILLSENKLHNLTAIRDTHEAWMRHILEVIYLNQHIPTDTATIIDIGSGGGIPGIPLAILRPQTRVTLLETTRKKADFLLRTSEELHLSNVTVLNMRAEDAARDPSYREHFQAAMCRAVGSLAEILELCTPFLAKNGYFYAIKGQKADSEAENAQKALSELNSELKNTKKLIPNATDNQSVLLTIQKTAPTPEKYPRRSGLPKKRPL